MRIIIVCVTYLALLVFSPDMPKDEIWRQTYKQCFLECIREGISRHACNLYCVHKADSVMKSLRKEESDVKDQNMPPMWQENDKEI